MTVRTQTDIRHVRRAIRRLTALATEGDAFCHVKDSHKRAVRPYIETWILPQLIMLLPKDEVKSLDEGDD